MHVQWTFLYKVKHPLLYTSWKEINLNEVQATVTHIRQFYSGMWHPSLQLNDNLKSKLNQDKINKNITIKSYIELNTIPLPFTLVTVTAVITNDHTRQLDQANKNIFSNANNNGRYNRHGTNTTF